MTVITMEGIPQKYTINRCIGMISKVINAQFEGLHFTPSSKKGSKMFHINVLDETKVNECIQKLDGLTVNNSVLTAYLSEKQPYINTKIKKIKKGKMRNRQLKMPQDIRVGKEKTFSLTRDNLIYELQDKYTALMDINKTAGNKLLCEIAQIISNRLRGLLEQSENCFTLSSSYRYKHPHTTDFDLIKMCLSKTGSKIVLTKEMLKPTPGKYKPMLADSIPYGDVQSAIGQYSAAIQTELSAYVKGLQTDLQVAEGQIDVAAQNKVREQFKKLAPSISFIVTESLTKHIMPPSNVTVLRIYGEPSLPKLATMTQFLKKYRGTMFRSAQLYNCAVAQAPNAEVPALLAADGTCVEGRNLVIRLFCKDVYKKIIRDIGAACRGSNDLNVSLDDEGAWEDWDEEEMK